MSLAEKPRVLLVDDSEATNALITAVLRRDFDVEVVTDGREAIERLTTSRYAVVLLDLRIPAVDGFGVLEFARKQDGDLLHRTIIVTASVTPRELDRVKPYPVFGVVAKPFEVGTLLNTVKSCAGRSALAFGAMLSGGVALLIADLLRQKPI
jgi:two-component system, sensor histidine kinase and response regulator